MINIKPMSLQDAIQLTEGCELIENRVVSFDTERNSCTREFVVHKSATGYIISSIDMNYWHDPLLVIEHDQHLMITPSRYAEVLADTGCKITSAFPLSNTMQAAIALYLLGESK